jgi:hypothetical protein
MECLGGVREGNAAASEGKWLASLALRELGEGANEGSSASDGDSKGGKHCD